MKFIHIIFIYYIIFSIHFFYKKFNFLLEMHMHFDFKILFITIYDSIYNTNIMENP